MNVQISVIIVSWNACSYLRSCLASLRDTGCALKLEVIVVDNSSSDGSPEMVMAEFPEVTLIRAGGNLGFARGNNLGLRHCQGQFIALINSDVVVHPECLQKLIAFLEHRPEVGLAGPKVQDSNGKLQLSCGRLPGVWTTACEFLMLHKVFPHWRMFGGFQLRKLDLQQPIDVEVLSGCFWVARRAAVDQVGGLDEQFFFYAEDVDWCKRFKDAGWSIVYVPEASATHFGGGSSANAPLRYSIEILRANLRYWKKHHGNLGRCAFYLLAMLQHGFRLLVRGFLRITGLATGEFNDFKLKEHMVCLRWLLTGKEV